MKNLVNNSSSGFNEQQNRHNEKVVTEEEVDLDFTTHPEEDDYTDTNQSMNRSRRMDNSAGRNRNNPNNSQLEMSIDHEYLN
jgi:hypothetical protein